MFEKEAEEEVNKVHWSYRIFKEVAQEYWQKGAEFGYNKANEWHYVKDELPISDEDRFYFVVDKWNQPMIARFYEGVWSNLTVIDDVIAWKEIVLPKLPKESE